MRASRRALGTSAQSVRALGTPPLAGCLRTAVAQGPRHARRGRALPHPHCQKQRSMALIWAQTVAPTRMSCPSSCASLSSKRLATAGRRWRPTRTSPPDRHHVAGGCPDGELAPVWHLLRQGRTTVPGERRWSVAAPATHPSTASTTLRVSTPGPGRPPREHMRLAVRWCGADTRDHGLLPWRRPSRGHGGERGVPPPPPLALPLCPTHATPCSSRRTSRTGPN
jgi:hypothetical protein